MKTKRHVGFTLVELMIVLGVISLLAALAMPSLIKARGLSMANACVINLKKIDDNKSKWALDIRRNSDDEVFMFDLVPAYLKLEPKCPAGTAVYYVGKVKDFSSCPNYLESDVYLKRHNQK